MNPSLFVFLGRSGCGKGTQAALLTEYLKKTNPETGVFYVSTGEEFRKLIQSESYTGRKVKSVVDGGKFAPPFLASMLWANVITNQFTENMHMIVDGTPRRFPEKAVFDTVAPFYGLGKPHIIFMNVSSEWATDKLLKRAIKESRKDDTEEAIKSRMQAFEELLSPIIESYRNDSEVFFHEINGDQTIAEVHDEIISKISH